MRFRLLFPALIIVMMSVACTEHQNGTLRGTVSPPLKGVRIIALRNGQTFLEVNASPIDGAFNLELPSGDYDISVHAPSSPFPLVFTGIHMDAGKSTSLSPIELVRSTGHASVRGRIFPNSDKTTVALYEGRFELASLQTDDKGRYEFTGLPTGTYSLRISAPEYAQDTIEVTVAGDQVATNNFRLLHADKISGVDWSTGTIRVIGTGFPPANAASMSAGRALAQRAAIVDAQRNLLSVLGQIRISPERSLKSYLGENRFNVTIRGFIQGYTILEEHELKGGKIQIVVELPLSGKSGLMHYLNKQP